MLHEYMMKIDALWAEGEVVAQGLPDPEKRQLLEFLEGWKNMSLQSGLLPGQDHPPMGVPDGGGDAWTPES